VGREIEMTEKVVINCGVFFENRSVWVSMLADPEN